MIPGAKTTFVRHVCVYFCGMSRTSRRRKREYVRPPVKHAQRPPVWQRKPCDACTQTVIVAEEDTGGGRLRGALLADEPDSSGWLVRRDDGFIVRDPEFAVNGERYSWHRCPVRNPR